MQVLKEASNKEKELQGRAAPADISQVRVGGLGRWACKLLWSTFDFRGGQQAHGWAGCSKLGTCFAHAWVRAARAACTPPFLLKEALQSLAVVELGVPDYMLISASRNLPQYCKLLLCIKGGGRMV